MEIIISILLILAFAFLWLLTEHNARKKEIRDLQKTIYYADVLTSFMKKLKPAKIKRGSIGSYSSNIKITKKSFKSEDRWTLYRDLRDAILSGSQRHKEEVYKELKRWLPDSTQDDNKLRTD